MHKSMIVVAACLALAAVGCNGNKNEPATDELARLDAYKPMGGTDTPLDDELTAKSQNGSLVTFDTGDDLTVEFATDTDLAELVHRTKLRVRRPLVMRFVAGRIELVDVPDQPGKEPTVYGRFECAFKMDPVRHKNVVVLTLKRAEPQEQKDKGLLGWLN